MCPVHVHVDCQLNDYYGKACRCYLWERVQAFDYAAEGCAQTLESGVDWVSAWLQC